MNITRYDVRKKHNIFCTDNCTCQICYNNGHSTIFYASYCKDCALLPEGHKSKEEFRASIDLNLEENKDIKNQVELEIKEKDIYHEPFAKLIR